MSLMADSDRHPLNHPSTLYAAAFIVSNEKGCRTVGTAREAAAAVAAGRDMTTIVPLEIWEGPVSGRG